MGKMLGLLTALLHSTSVVFYKKSVNDTDPFAVNFFKNTVALLLLFPTNLILGHTSLAAIPAKHIALLLASGVIGIGISDTFFLMMLKRLGASRTALVDCMYSPFVILFSFLLYGETLPIVALLGGMLIVGSIVVSSRGGFGVPMTARDFWIGCALGATTMTTVSFAIVMIKPVLSLYPLTLMSEIRMMGGLGTLVLLLPFHPQKKSVFALLRPQRTWLWMVLGTFFGSYLAILAWIAGFRYSQAGVVALLNQTSTVIIVVFAWLFLKEPMTRLKLAAVAMAFAGAAIILL
jgi:drug/metabolite transporter (DMT)-like permease